MLSRVQPGELKAALPAEAPELGESLGTILADVDRQIIPAITHWNHPGFFAYFSVSSSAPGIFAEMISAILNAAVTMLAETGAHLVLGKAPPKPVTL